MTGLQPAVARVVVAQGFKTFLSRLAPLESETNARLRHTVSIYQAIVREFGRVQRPERIGSHSRQTAIRRYSDVDFLIRVPRAQALWGGQRVASTTTLRRLRETLEERFRDTSVHIDGPAVVAEFADGRDAVDVVPAIYEGTTGRDGYPVFLIPDGSGGWLRTSPHRHSRYILQQVVRSGGKLQAVVRFLKAWKFARTPEIPVVGFHIELLLAGSELCVGAKTYADCLLQAFSLLRHRRGSALLDPLGLFGPVPLARTPAQMESVLRSIDHAQSHAMAACLAQENGRVAEAFRQWNIVFNGDFPAPPGRFRT